MNNWKQRCGNRATVSTSLLREIFECLLALSLEVAEGFESRNLRTLQDLKSDASTNLGGGKACYLFNTNTATLSSHYTLSWLYGILRCNISQDCSITTDDSNQASTHSLTPP